MPCFSLTCSHIVYIRQWVCRSDNFLHVFLVQTLCTDCAVFRCPTHRLQKKKSPQKRKSLCYDLRWWCRTVQLFAPANKSIYLSLIRNYHPPECQSLCTRGEKRGSLVTYTKEKVGKGWLMAWYRTASPFLPLPTPPPAPISLSGKEGKDRPRLLAPLGRYILASLHHHPLPSGALGSALNASRQLVLSNQLQATHLLILLSVSWHTRVHIKEFYPAFNFIEQSRIQKLFLFKHKQT